MAPPEDPARTSAVAGEHGIAARDIRDSVIVQGDNNQVFVLKLGGAGGRLEPFDPARLPALWRPRPRPLSLRPRQRRDRLDRDAEIDLLYRSDADGVVEYCGAPGIGKSTLLAALAHDVRSDRFPHGVVWLAAQGLALDDLLVDLFNAVCECSLPFRPARSQIASALQHLEVLVLLDGPGLAADAIESVLSTAPKATFVLASTTQVCFSAMAQDLTGLPAAEALALFERGAGRPLTEAERSAADGVCATLAGHPLNILRAAALVRSGAVAATDLQRLVETAPDPSALVAERLVAGLDDHEQSALRTLAALEGAPLPTRVVADSTGDAGAQAALRSLEQKSLAESHSPSFSAVLPLPAAVAGDADAARLRVADALAESGLRGDEGIDTRAVHTLARGLDGADAAPAVIRLVRATEAQAIVSGRFEAWGDALLLAERAAIRQGDRAAEAWAAHQLGTRALATGALGEAARRLGHALELRKQLGDREGAATTQHNIEVMKSLAGPSSGGPSGPGTVRRPWGWFVGGIVLLAVIAALLVTIVIVLGGGGSQPAPTGSIATATTTTPTQPAAQAPAAPRIDSGPSSTVAGEDAQFTISAGSPAEVGFRCSVDGAGFADCSTPVSVPAQTLGDHVLSVIAVDPAGRTSAPTSVSWTSTAPQPPPAPVIDSGPSTKTAGSDAQFTFHDAQQGTTFRCSVDNGPFSDCTSPATVAKQSAGDHTFSVIAVDPATGVESSPTTVSWTAVAPIL